MSFGFPIPRFVLRFPGGRSPIGNTNARLYFKPVIYLVFDEHAAPFNAHVMDCWIQLGKVKNRLGAKAVSPYHQTVIEPIGALTEHLAEWKHRVKGRAHSCIGGINSR